jgi:cyclopropane-fatty-acyl-phospholipid synthase
MNSSHDAAIVDSSPRECAASAPSFYQKLLLRALQTMQSGRLNLHLPGDQNIVLGGEADGPQASVIVKDPAFFRKCVLFGNVGFGEAYMDGDWETPDLRAVIEWFIHNLRADPKLRGSSQRLRGLGWLKFANRVFHLLRPNSLKNSRRNIAEHYDLGNDFYQLWLDPTMTYSAAKFTSAEQTLEDAQRAKYDALCQKLRLKPGDRVLEIGCGWGGFSIHAASNYGCHVTGVTISKAQYEEAVRRVRDAGLGERIDIRFQDYRTIEGQFDKIASIEMLEAVGDKYLETYFAKCDSLLAPHGMLAFQVITVPDTEYDDLRKGTDWIQKHIFPGSLLLCTRRINEAVNRTGHLYLHSFEDLAAGYARTLREWWVNFNARLDEVRRVGFDERFIRKWNYYLRYCEAAFATRNISVVQACYTKPLNGSLHREDGVS